MKMQANASNIQAVNLQPTSHSQKANRLKKCLIAATLAALGATILLGNAMPAFANTMHARSILGFQLRGVCASQYGVADAYLKGTFRRNLWIESHEELGLNYIRGNAGIGHAHHHSGGCPFNSSPDDGGIGTTAPPMPVKLGLPGTSLFVLETWLPNPAGDQITVALSPDSFLQVDLAQLSPTNPLESRASLAADGGLAGSVVLSAWMDDDLTPHVETLLTGIFEGLPVDLVSHPNGVVSLQFRGPLSWTVPGQVETFDTEVESSITGVNDVGPNTEGSQQ